VGSMDSGTIIYIFGLDSRNAVNEANKIVLIGQTSRVEQFPAVFCIRCVHIWFK